MKIIIKDTTCVIIRFDRDEELINLLIEYSQLNSISTATFSCIGSSAEVTLAYYNLETKQYEDHLIKEDLEVLSVTGNIGQMNEQPVIHAHGVFGRKDLSTIGGHIKKLIVSATCEVTLQRLEGTMERKKDEVTGLNLLQ